MKRLPLPSRLALASLALASLMSGPAYSQADVNWMDELLREAETSKALQRCRQQVAARPDADQARFELGMVQVIRSVEKLGHSLYKMGLRPRLLNAGGAPLPLPVLRMPVPNNPDPEVATYAKFHQAVVAFNRDLAEAEATLAAVDDPNVNVALHFAEITLDLDGDLRGSEAEKLWRIYDSVAGNRGQQAALPRGAARELLVRFDYADALWLRGYCHLMMGVTDVVLAYDWSELFRRSGHVMFQRVEGSHEAVSTRMFIGPILDMIALAHNAVAPLADAKRIQSAQRHLLRTVALSRQMWTAVDAETDNQHEWIPNPRQTAPRGQPQVTSQMVRGWRLFLDEAEAVLKGSKRIPFWRQASRQATQSFNLGKVFAEPPKELDVVLWVHGADAAPYLEEGGDTTEQAGETWRRIQSAFGGRFFGFAIWVN